MIDLREESEEIYKFKATITFQRYYNEDSAWGVFGFSTEDDIPHYIKQTKEFIPFEDNKQANDNLKYSSLTGKMQELTVGGEYMIKAKYKCDKKYGDQYEPISIYALVPQSKENQLLFLQSIISPTIARNIIDVYPNIIDDVVNGRLTDIDYDKVKGVREFTWKAIKEKILNNYLISDIIAMLKPLGVTYVMIKKLLSEESNPVLLKKQLEENPYIMTKIQGCGFKKIDQLALKLKPELLNSSERLVAFTKHFFTEMGESDGHTWCSIDVFKNAIINSVPECADKTDWILQNEDFLHFSEDKNRVGLKKYYDIEMEIFNILLEKSKVDTKFSLSDEQINNAIKQAEKEQGFEYVKEQLDVINNSLKRSVSLISGKAGTGKSSIMRAIIGAYQKNNYSVTSCALSAMASKRITEATGFPAATIHRTLGCQGFNKFLYNKDNPLITSVVFLDEGSMVNASLFLRLLNAVGKYTRIVICGDHKQLPPIGYGNVFSDLIETFDDTISSKLTKPMRQAQMSGILSDANLIRENVNPVKEFKPKIVHGQLQDMYYLFRNNRQTLFDIAVKTYLKAVEKDGIDNVVIITPRKQNCLNSTQEINKIIQEKLLGDEKQEIVGYEMSFKLGAKVVQTVNDYDNNVFNGDIGYVTKIANDTNGKSKMEYCEVTFKDSLTQEDKIVRYNKKDLSVLNLAYALTTHKIQGSGIKTVIGIIDYTHYQLLDNCMLYTMLTRAKKRCLLLAEPNAFLHCIRTSHNNRNTWMMLENAS